MVNETNENTPFDLNLHVARLLQAEPFFASISRRVNKSASTAIPTAGVRVNSETAQFELIYNPSFFEKLTNLQRTDVLKHEFYHLVFEHVTGRRPDNVNHRIWNFATDLAINSHLDHLPPGCLKPGLCDTPFEEFESGLSAEAYLVKLQKQQEEKKEEKGQGKGNGKDSESGDGGNASGNGMPGDGQFDSHDDWGGDQVANNIAHERMKGYIKKGAEEAASKGHGWGSVPSSVRRDIMAKLQTHIDWKKVLRYFVKTSTRANKTSTVKRVNKRYRYIHPGKKVQRRARIAISIDQSGSVSDEMLAAFFAELNKLSKLASFTVIPFDTVIDESLIYEWKQGENRKTQRVMQGGTDFNPPTEYVNRHGFDGHIVLTDLMAPKPKPSKCQRMWMTTKYYASRPYFQTSERIIAVD
jgi:predicted metal-dependent peptidase